MTGIQVRTPVSADGRLGPAAEHPGLSDPDYLSRRRGIAALARGHRVGDPYPSVDYLASEERTWRTVHRALWKAQDAHACRAALDAREHAPVPADHIPQHAEVGARLRRLTGFEFTLAGGVVANKRFLGSMADGHFHAVQFVRHPAVPLFTPEPDVIHDVFGHGIHLAAPAFADIYRLIGRAAMRVEREDVLQMISDVYWFTLEYGVLEEGGTPKAYGAALLSSYGEIGRLPAARVRPLDIDAVLATPYDIRGYQPVLFSARTLDEVTDTVAGFLDGLDDDSEPRRRTAVRSTGAAAGVPPGRG
ncbi:phenylalanine 4-monooxygenase [Streptomyces sp. SID161]|uniref:phenylalanine 4-monooxygenase n=1 Tax=Streptomyces sp. SID161 TaxID=2690251 RepID=UPI00136BDF2F|nr:phenylalanine 4-monooxygenase [Streptomyces sp. SID161]MYW45764.1 phenylalanine 4-monooxygenase [Streptomyces sp. SID161]